MKAFGESGVHAIDFSERSHNHLRTDLHSSGRARSFSCACHKTFVGQVRAAHMERENPDPAKPRTVTAAKVKNQNHEGGNAFLSFRNLKLSVHKAIHVPNRAMTHDEILGLEDRWKQLWGELTEEERINWGYVAQSERAGRALHADSEAEGDGDHEKKPPTPVWFDDGGVDGQPIDPKRIAKEHTSRTPAERRKAAYHNPKLFVTEAPPTASLCEKPIDGSNPVLGCYFNKKTVCRTVLPNVLFKDFETIRTLIQGFVDSMNIHVARSGKILFLLAGQKEVEEDGVMVKRDITAVSLIALVRQRPKTQHFVQCVVKLGNEWDNNAIYFNPPDFPATFRLSTTFSRISERFKTLCVITNEDLSLTLAMTYPGYSWTLEALSWTFANDDDSLFNLRVEARGEKFVKPKKTRAAKHPVHLPEHLNLDPFAAGERQAFVPPCQPSSSGPPDGDDVEVEESGEGEGDLGDPIDLFYFGSSADEDAIDDMLDTAHGVFGEPIDLDLEEELHEGIEVLEESEAEVEQEEIDALKDCDSGPPVDDGDTDMPNPRDSVAASDITDAGHVTCSLPPWSEAGVVGILSSFPKKAPPGKQKVVMHCWQHRDCGTPPMPRGFVQDSLLLEWLFNTTIVPPSLDPATKKS